MSDVNPQKQSLRESLKMVFTDRQVLAMLLLGIASGLPYVVVGGTLNAWFTTLNIKMSTIGIMSWATLAYAFKYMWSAALQSRKTPFSLKIGPRRFWMFCFLAIMVVGIFCISMFDPTNAQSLRNLALLSVGIAIASASFDIVLAAWRIESARDGQHLDVLSVVEQFGYRTASFLAGAGALIFADYFGWERTFMGAAGLLVLTALGIVLAAPIKNIPDIAPKSVNIRQGRHLSSNVRNVATLIVIAAWGIGFYLIGSFMLGALNDPAAHSSRLFIRQQGPVVIVLTVVLLGVVAAMLVWKNKQAEIQNSAAVVSGAKPGILLILFLAIIEPMMEMVGRLKWATILILALILSYRFTDAIWGSFAYPFYLGENYGALGHTLTEIGLASKTIGVVATILGILFGGLAMLKFGRMPVLVVGAILAAITNLLFVDLALGAPYMDGFLAFTHLDGLYSALHLDQRMARLITAIAAENIAVGLASAASVAYLSSIVNKEYAAVQYALLVSLTMLLGVLGRGAIGEVIETQGFATAFILCAWMGSAAVVLAGLEWWRQARVAQKPD